MSLAIAHHQCVQAGQYEQRRRFAGKQAPKIARASGAFASLPRSKAKAAGIMAKNAASAVIVIGRTRIDAALRMACIGVKPSA